MNDQEIPAILQEPKQIDIEFDHIDWACSYPINFITSKGVKKLEPGKSYDKNLNEVK